MTHRKEIDELKDQLTLFLLLCKLKELDFQTQRLKLQKLVYLTDIFGTILKRKPTTYTFQVYKLGPFSKEIYTDIERLVSIGAAKVKKSESWDPNHDHSFKYEVKEAGMAKIAKIPKILDVPEFDIIEKAIEFAVQAAGHLSGESIRRLVYSEPNYIEAQEKGFESIINPEYTFAIRFKEMARRISYEEYRIKLNEEEIAWLYLNFMRTIQSQHMHS